MDTRGHSGLMRKMWLWGAAVAALTGCLVENPVKEVGAPDEYAYNQWLLSRIFLYPEQLADTNTADALTKASPIDSATLDNVKNLYARLQDPFTSYTPPAQASAVEDGIVNSVAPGSLGLELRSEADSIHPLLIAYVYPQSPASEAGLHKGDRLLRYNGVELTGTHASAQYDSLFNADVAVELHVRHGVDTLVVNMTKRDVAQPTVFVDTIGTIPVIQIRSFVKNTLNGEGTAAEFRAALLQTDGTAGRIVSVRSNLGGEIKQCVGAADEIVPAGKVLSNLLTHRFDAHGVAKVDTATYTATAGGAAEGDAVVLLVNGYSASCSEIFAAALSESAQVPLVGDSTYGKGIGQTLWNTPSGALAIISSIEVRTPGFHEYHRVGIAPDYPAEASSVLATALGLLKNGQAKQAISCCGLRTDVLDLHAIAQRAQGPGAWMAGENP
jgi:C-terminal peptidase prc